MRFVLCATGAALAGSPAAAQVGAAVSLFSDSRFRGYSLSEGRPVGILDLSYDARNGIYGALSASAVAARGEGLRALGLQVNGGYATRLNSRVTLDLGAIHSAYSHYSGLSGSRSYTELYAGIGGKNVSSRLSISPGYFHGGWTAHGEVNTHFNLSRDLSLVGDLGLLVPLGRYSSHPVYDARLGLDQRIGRLSLHGAFTTRGRGREMYLGRHSSRSALIVGVSYRL